MTYKDVTAANPLLYNITLKIHQDLSKAWLHDMVVNYLPACTDGKIIVSTSIHKILVPQEDEDLTYAVQFVFATQALYDEYGLQSLKKFLDLLDSSYRGKYVYFTTKMEILHSHTVPSQN